MAGKYNTWLRTKLADRIRDNGGYSRHSASYAISWCVRFYATVESPEQATALLVEHGHLLSEADLAVQFPRFDELFTAMDMDAIYSFACQRLQDDLWDDEGMRMWSPETAKRYGFNYEGDGADRPFECALGGYGRGGKHVCLTSFECESLDISSGELADLIDPNAEKDIRYDRAFPNVWCRKLMGIMDELDATLTDENANRCGLYYETDEIARDLGLFD